MQQHAEGAFAKGLFYVVVTVLFWGILPIALVFSLSLQDGTTITWFRFLIAAIIVFAYQLRQGKLSEFKSLSGRDWALLGLAAFSLIVDYIFYIYGLNYIDPSAMQVFSQTTPLFMALGGMLFFKEKISAFQGLCFVALFVGLGLFFNAAIAGFSFGESRFLTGALLAVTASIIWAVYAMLQKKLVDRLSSTNILLFIYICAVFGLLPMSELTSFGGLDGAAWAIITFCALNTLIAYGAFAESLNYWPTTHISSVIALTPLATIAASFMAHQIWPAMVPFPAINPIGWTGVALTLVAMVLFNLKR